MFGTPIAAYDDAPAAAVRGLTDDCAPSPGDPEPAAAIIQAAETDSAPLRVVPGSNSHRHVVTALRKRLAEVEGEETTSAATGRPA